MNRHFLPIVSMSSICVFQWPHVLLQAHYLTLPDTEGTKRCVLSSIDDLPLPSFLWNHKTFSLIWRDAEVRSL